MGNFTFNCAKRRFLRWVREAPVLSLKVAWRKRFVKADCMFRFAINLIAFLIKL